jgi:hypothetical protein
MSEQFSKAKLTQIANNLQLLIEDLGDEGRNTDSEICIKAHDALRAIIHQPVSAQPAGEAPEVVGYLWSHENGLKIPTVGVLSPFYPRKGNYSSEPLMTVAQHTSIVAALQARAVVMPELGDTETGEWGDAYRRGWNAYAREYARLNGKGGV